MCDRALNKLFFLVASQKYPTQIYISKYIDTLKTEDSIDSEDSEDSISITPWKCQKIFSFLTFSVCIEMIH